MEKNLLVKEKMTMSLFKNKYRIESARHPHWDYRNAAAYFITICTRDRICYFGNFVDDKLMLNDTGKIVESEWLKTPLIRLDMNLQLGEFVVMPNHFHGMVIIGENRFNTIDPVGIVVETPCMASLQQPPSSQNTGNKNSFGPQRKNLSSIIRGFKSACTTQIRMIAPAKEFGWQPRFHDHIIRNQQEYDRISHYIIMNPENWVRDKFYGIA